MDSLFSTAWSMISYPVVISVDIVQDQGIPSL